MLCVGLRTASEWVSEWVVCKNVSGLPRLRRPLHSPVVANAQSDVVLHCDVIRHESSTSPTIHWFKNGEVVVTSDYFLVDESGQRLTILGLLPSDAGHYQCFVSNEAGMIQSAARLVVLPQGSLVIMSSAIMCIQGAAKNTLWRKLQYLRNGFLLYNEILYIIVKSCLH